MESFWHVLGALGLPLPDFCRTLGALGVAFETFAGLSPFCVALGRTWEVSRGFLVRFFKCFSNFIVLSVIFRPGLQNSRI